ncbi:MAG: thioredoxin domain-containing protein [Ignavibacteriales bacterium]|nr:thioredoxin domain-containing protein [Ignavibacteriales bacterium]MCF8305729.1 thioredoxin domain-containing protein [Ignavibacteriales bacterium]MCF8315451.1 thioredoxin domain-containing protein [Ignavibacteriales bacterium]MCF8437021.1 thioredoxin domain-containing protein [Ignavibacteriales bacterium]
MDESKTNRLINEKSQYLLQHAHNPVDWFPWGMEAFSRAKELDRPVFLSIGYSTCHWCHVMERESFEDIEVAELMNNSFISVKVDREERPDIDHVYMSVCQIMTGHGGWPLTVILTPDKKPFFCGTYFPKESKYGRIGLKNLIAQINDVWKEKRSEVFESADKITEYLEEISNTKAGEYLDPGVLDNLFDSFEQRFDAKFGGFSQSPKFPSPQNFLFLLKYWRDSGRHLALEMTVKTLTEMRKGGIWDHIGFGFHRYSTDRQWLLPHFEKMLYDQAMLLSAYTETYSATREERWKQTAYEISGYLIRDMYSPEGAFYSAEDADSEGAEGKFYIWSEQEIDSILNKEDSDLFKLLFNIKTEGNFQEEATGAATAANIPHLIKTIQEYSLEYGLDESRINEKTSEIFARLYGIRKSRVAPLKDTKILTDWNGMTITSFAKAAAVFSDKNLKQIAEKSVKFILENMVTADGMLIHTGVINGNRIPAVLDDYTWMIRALISVYELTFNPAYLEKAISLQKMQDAEFLDSENGGYFHVSSQGEKILLRKKEIYDGAYPCGNSVALMNLIFLWKITGDISYRDAIEKHVAFFSEVISKSPSAFVYSLLAFSHYVEDGSNIVIAGDSVESSMKILSELHTIYSPGAVFTLLNPENTKELTKLIPHLADIKLPENSNKFYFCRDFACSLPTEDIEIVIKELRREK